MTQYIPPKGEYEVFKDDSHYMEKLKEWGLRGKNTFLYKDKDQHSNVTIKGFEVYGKNGEYNSLVIEFADGRLTCIHPAYLKEMQSSSFVKELSSQQTENIAVEKENKAIEEPRTDEEHLPEKAEAESQKVENPVQDNASTPAAKKATKKKEKAPKITLPEDKVHFTGKVKQLALSWNHFNEENDEVVVFEDVRIEQEEPIEIGLAWGSHSKTLKKLELEPGMELEFDGKIVKKSLPKGKDVEDESLLLDVPVGYKINNPSKIVKK
ncbi:hypothetical protein [Bacillus sp. EB01]|uniref:hypothetical protein n=1 Tax=Bacillus sp. EB01 TaxID=1347086 RepID=UPI0005C72766|nr:hypothetical protein [Bacillus sp. EB01]